MGKQLHFLHSALTISRQKAREPSVFKAFFQNITKRMQQAGASPEKLMWVANDDLLLDGMMRLGLLSLSTAYTNYEAPRLGQTHKVPGYSSKLIFEVWEISASLKVRVQYNSQTMKLSGACRNKIYCPIEDIAVLLNPN
jgi:hypothetical protein